MSWEIVNETRLQACLSSCFRDYSPLAIDGYLSVKREIKLFDTEMKREALQIGHAMKDLVVEVWHTSGQRRAMQLIRAANNEEHLVNST